MLLAPLAVLPLAVVWRPDWSAGRAYGVAARCWRAWSEWGCWRSGRRALHLDGLADTVDGLGSGWDRERALAIMRRGDVGPMGVVALILVLAAQAVAASNLTADWRGGVLLATVIAGSRSSLVIACRPSVPPARPDGLGATVAGSVSPPAASVVGGLVAVALLAAVLLADRPWWTAAVAVVAGAAVAYGMGRLAGHRLGGITGDVLGATVEVTLTTILLAVIVG